MNQYGRKRTTHEIPGGSWVRQNCRWREPYKLELVQQALLGAFGDKYSEYMKRTKRLVPFLY